MTPSAPSAGPGHLDVMLQHDGVVHHPMGAGAYYFADADRFLQCAILKPLGLDRGIESPRRLYVHVGVQPNNSPHIGTIVTLACAGFLARSISSACRPSAHLEVTVSLDLVDTAPDDAHFEMIDGIRYQRSHRETGSMNSVLGDYDNVLDQLHSRVNSPDVMHRFDCTSLIRFQSTLQADLFSYPRAGEVLDAVIRQRDTGVLSTNLSPRTQGKWLGIRSSCPVTGCGRSDKDGKGNKYLPSTCDNDPLHSIEFQCHLHGPYCIDLNRPDDLKRLELNTTLRNLLRTFLYALDPDQNARHLRVTGADYAGLYQERTLLSSIDILTDVGALPKIPTPVIVYSPLIVDLAGSKISKSLYLRQNAYRYLEE